MKSIPDATEPVNRETALLKHMFNMAERWGLYQGTNPVRLVKFLPETNLQFQTGSEADEQLLLESSPPYLRELILFATNTGPRCGDLLDLKWEEVDIEEKRLSLIMGKTGRRLEIPLNETALAILAGKRAVMHGQYIFYNPVTGDRFHDLKAGFKAILKRAGMTGITWHTLRHTFASRLTRSRRGPGDREGAAGAFDNNHDHAVRAQQPRYEGARSRQVADL